MFADQDQGVVFYETVLGFKQQRHTFIEAVPLPWDLYEDAPAYFRESIMAAESEWSQNRKLIDFSKRPGGFRRSLVPTLPYFAIQWDYKGEKGYGHVIEGMDDNAGHAVENENGEKDASTIVDEESKGGAIEKYVIVLPCSSGDADRFRDRYFAAEILGNILELDPHRWRRPRRMDFSQNASRVQKFFKVYQKYDWTSQLAG